MNHAEAVVTSDACVCGLERNKSGTICINTFPSLSNEALNNPDMRKLIF